MDKYEVGDYVRRDVPAGALSATVLIDGLDARAVTHPTGVQGGVWRMIASRIGIYQIAWRLKDGVEQVDTFEVSSEPIY